MSILSMDASSIWDWIMANSPPVGVPEEDDLGAVRLVEAPSDHTVVAGRGEILLAIDIVRDGEFVTVVHGLGGLLGEGHHGRGQFLQPGDDRAVMEQDAAVAVDAAPVRVFRTLMAWRSRQLLA